jgi:hypothetical protein
LLILGSFLKITEAAHIFGQLFSRLRFFNNLGKNVLAYILGDFFPITSGHPVATTQMDEQRRLPKKKWTQWGIINY